MEVAVSNPRWGRKAAVMMLALLWSAGAWAQLEIGDNWKMTMNGNLGYGYGGSFGSAEVASTHSQGLNGSADLNGYYFNPNFLSFHVRPYYQRDQSNSDSQLVSRGTGIGGSANFFSGSRFPGSISFGKDFSTNSEFRIAGVPTVSADSSGQNFAISWSALVPHYPTVTATYSIASSAANVLGLESHNSSKNLNVSSGYRLGGWDLHGHFSHDTSSFEVPAFLTAEALTGGGTSNGYGFSASHMLPLRGSFGVSVSHTSFNSESGTDWNSTYYTVSNSFNPLRRLAVFQNFNYTTNLAAQFGQTLTNNGVIENLFTDSESKGLSYSAGASFLVGHGINTSAQFTHRIQWLMGKRYEDTQYGGAINFNHQSRLFGMLYFGVGVVDTLNQQGNQGMGFTGTVGMNKRFGRWETSADFNYFQNVTTLYVMQTTSSYMFGASVKRKISNELRWTGSFRGSRSGIVLMPGTGNSGESFSTSVNWRGYNVSGAYSQADGVAVFTSTGEIAPTPVGGLLTDNFLLFNGRSWSVGGGTRLFRRVTVGGGYSHFTTSTLRGVKGVLDSGNRYNMRAEYRLRKFSVIGGYSHSDQIVSTLGPESRIVNSYYVSLMRWFNVF